MPELANVFGGRMDERKKWRYHLPSSWERFFSVGKKIGQITQDIKCEDVCKHERIDKANAFDVDRLWKDAEGVQLSGACKGVDVAKIQSAL